MDRGAWRATVHGVAKSQTRWKWLGTRILRIRSPHLGSGSAVAILKCMTRFDEQPLHFRLLPWSLRMMELTEGVLWVTTILQFKHTCMHTWSGNPDLLRDPSRESRGQNPSHTHSQTRSPGLPLSFPREFMGKFPSGCRPRGIITECKNRQEVQLSVSSSVGRFAQTWRSRSLITIF